MTSDFGEATVFEVAQNMIRGLGFYVEVDDFIGLLTSLNDYDVLTAKRTMCDEFR